MEETENQDFDIQQTITNIEERFHPELREKLSKIAALLEIHDLEGDDLEILGRSNQIYETMHKDMLLHFKKEEEEFFPAFRLLQGDFFKQRRYIKNAVADFDFEHDLLGENFFDKQLEVIDLVLPLKKNMDVDLLHKEIKNMEEIIKRHLTLEIAMSTKVKDKLKEMEKIKND